MITPAIATLALAHLEARAEAMAKGITAPDIVDLVKEDLEGEAHNTLWRASSPNELTILKLIPSTPATSVKHEFDVITSYGESRGFGFFGETALPLSTKPGFARKETYIRLIGEMTDVYLLAHLQRTIRVEGATNADAIAKQLLILSMLKKKNQAIYFSDTSTQRLGVNSMRFKGLLQQIREGTDGTLGASPFGSHVIDMEGQPLTPATIRAKAAKVLNLFGRMNCLIMDGFVRADFEAALDGAVRLNMPIQARAFMIGQNVGGMHTSGGDILFHTDNGLSPLFAQGQYVAAAIEGAPTSPPAVAAQMNASPSGANVSKFNAGDGGEYFWMITEWKNGRESLGRRFPATPGSSLAVPVGAEVEFDVTPTDPLSDSFKFYRGNAGEADTEAYGIFEVANSQNGGAVTAYDLNHWRPNTSVAFAFNIRSEASEFLHEVPNGTRSQYSLAVERSEKFLGMEDNPLNTVSLASLGPAMGTMEIAPILPTTSRPMLYSACAPQIRNPFQNVAFINVGSATIRG